MTDVVHAFLHSPALAPWRAVPRFDEWGGLLRSRAARRACPTPRQSRDVANDFGQMGFRVPAVVVSP